MYSGSASEVTEERRIMGESRIQIYRLVIAYLHDYTHLFGWPISAGPSIVGKGVWFTKQETQIVEWTIYIAFSTTYDGTRKSSGVLRYDIK